jgi:hypothetical protein
MTMMRAPYTLFISICLILAVSGPAQANWSEKFTGNTFDLSTWQFQAYPAVTGTFQNAIAKGADGNSYLVLTEVTPPDLGGSGFGMGLPSQEQFADVRVGAVVNVNGEASHSYHGLGARISYFVDDGMATGAPGIVASGYIMLVHWEQGPANLRLEVRKFVNLQENIMKMTTEVPVIGLDNARSFYAELDVVGANPVYITGSLYAQQGGALVVRTPTLVDTNAVDPWENPGVHDATYAGGVSIIFGANQVLTNPGFTAAFDDISSRSDGPAAAVRCPADGETNVPINTVLRWTEGAFATSRELWFGPQGAMQKVTPNPTEASYAPGTLESGKTYQWRVDEIGAAGTVAGPVLTFTTGECLSVDDFESYADDAQIASAWPHNIAGFDYVFREITTVHQGAQSMRFSYQNQYEPFFTEATYTFDTPQDWTAYSDWVLYFVFRGDPNNAEQPLWVGAEDSAGDGLAGKVAGPHNYAVQSKYWRQWGIALSHFTEAGTNLGAITKLTIRVGDGNGSTGSTQKKDDLDTIYIDDIRLCPPVSPNTN